ncbi:iron complex transport system permease protein [Stutzerimonas xanthomarina]|uniref:Iron complex transport system permease protein n=3 Tax=Stutzerimonas xanthomarina TaxID=271420 RepID=A0A1M5PQ36_9GAMM|nr:iron complex transport system permease protein [Stutzerimonas xanthomarina]SHH03801.1 iron complex transport system permease protein [Stutzerimonas xanthomarina DSM 18231]
MQALMTDTAPAPPAGISARYLITLIGLAILAVLHLNLGMTHWTPAHWSLQPPAAGSLDALEFGLSVLPRLTMALLVGAALGLSGSVLQQLTQNRLASPMTLGAASGAWLGLTATALLSPTLAATHGHWAALGGALAAVGLALLIAGRQGAAGLPVILAGMALNLLLGAIATAILLLHNQQSRGLFIWGAGDLGQIDWHWVQWLWPKLLIGLLVIALAPRPLTLLQLGATGASARGLSLWPVMLALFLASLWLTSAAITAVGLIGFIGLITPNLARLFGARSARDELLYSALLGALLLLGTDTLTLALNRWFSELIPSGATAALIGAPALLWLSRRQLAAEDRQSLAVPSGAGLLNARRLVRLLLAGGAAALVTLLIARGPSGWTFGWPTEALWSLRWPRLLAAIAAGCGLAVAGTMLQRLLRNPLASPDILGLTAGATLAVVLAVMLFGAGSMQLIAPIAAFAGSLVVLGLLLLFGHRHHYSPGIMVLVGVSLAALLNTALQVGLTRGPADALALLGWLAGSTYRVEAREAIALSGGVAVLVAISLTLHRALTLISIGSGVALSRGLDVPRARLALLLLVSLLCAVVTSLLGPVAFLGLLAPHMAALLGARRALPQLLLAALLGGWLMLVSDWIGRSLLFPLEVPVGLVASILCGLYFLYLLIRQRGK